MQRFFPSLDSANLANIPSGSLVFIYRSGKIVWTAFVTAERSLGGGVGVVVLQGDVDGRRPLPLFLKEYRDDTCLHLKTPFQIQAAIDTDGFVPLRRHAEQPGLLVMFESRMYFRAATLGGFDDEFVLVDVESGEVRSDGVPSSSWTFGSWAVAIQNPDTRAITSLASYPARV